MSRHLLLVLLSFLLAGTLAAQTSLTGKVTDEKKEPVPFANVVVELNGIMVTGSTTDINGKYTIKPLNPGKYTLKASSVGYSTSQVDGVVIRADIANFYDMSVKASTELVEEVIVQDYQNPVFEKDQTKQGVTLTKDEIAKMPGRGNSVALTVAGVYSEGGEVGSIRGARASGNSTYVDGVKVIGSSNIPKSAIEQVEVITGGLSARYGDVTGGVQSYTTKGPSNVLFGGAEIVTSKLLDKYDYNLAALSISGPILRKKADPKYPDRREAILGYFLSGEFAKVKDSRPFASGTWKAKDEVRESITANPLRAVDIGFGTVLNAAYLNQEDFEKTDVRLNAGNYSLNLQGKMTLKATKTLNITLGGSAYHQNSNNFDYGSSLFNWDNNSQSLYTNWRVYARMTQKFNSDAEDKEAGGIKNVYYSVQVDYEKTDGISQDKDHKDNFFNYGYIGKFKTYKLPSYSNELQLDSVTGLQAHVLNGFFDTLISYEYSPVNYELANYTQRYYDLFDNNAYYRNRDLIQNGGGLLNGDSPESIYGLWASPGALTTGYSHSDGAQFRVSAEGSADIGSHAFSFGIEFEQRQSSYFSLAPTGLWTLGRGLMNKHIEQLDFSQPQSHYLTDEYGNLVYSDLDPLLPVFMDTISYPRLYSAADQALFDVKFREYLGLDIMSLDWVDIDSYDPSELRLDYFSADELLNSGNSLVGYQGYDAWGNKLTYQPSLQDFFSKVDPTYNRLTRPIAAFQPTYGAFWLQDKFVFKDLIFNIGLRIDRYDANQMVLIDNYSLYDLYRVGDSDAKGLLTNAEHPDNIGNGYAVYVDNLNDPTKILGYRNGSTWYDARGREVSDPGEVATSTGMNPYLINPDVDMTSANYNVNMSFRDYEPQITIMPRVAFSFPISDEANFFAHYDILSTRPEGNVMDPADYLFMQVRTQGSSILGNPNLKPEKTIEYELGFKQLLTDASALTLSAYYREMRDMTQAISIVGAYPVYKYFTYGNIDFGTVKAFSATYDLRRTGNVQFRASYTLQFANGTGSGPTDGFNLINSGQPNLRTTIPLSSDQRHSFLGSIDFRFAEGRGYNGPKGFWEDIFQNMGANLTARSGSGSPFSKRNVDSNVLEGSINGSRKPWRTTLDLRVDKDIVLVSGGEKKRKWNLNIYLEVFNLLNSKTVINVYSTTGNPDDNGYLQVAANQPSINSQVDPEAYRNYYRMAINNPYNYGVPRQTRIGVSMGF